MNITVTIDGVRAESGGIPRLILNFLAKNTSDLNLGIITVNAEMRVISSFAEQDISRSYFIGYAVLEPQGGQFPKHTDQTWTLALPLYPYTLQKIEEMRKGADLFLTGLFFCVAVNMPDLVSPLTGLARASVSTPGYSTLYCPFRVAQSDWVRILKTLGYGDTLLIEVPLRSVPAKARMRKALAHLEDAWGHFNEANDEETLVSCYKAFEFLAKQAQVRTPDDHAFEKLLAGIDVEEKRRRLAQLMDYLCRFLALTRHEAGHEKLAVDRRDSEYALILAQASLGYLAKSMTK